VVVMNVAILWDITPSSSYVNRRFGGTYYLRLQGRNLVEQETSVQQMVMILFLLINGSKIWSITRIH
jgi:hypothetical protein